MHQYSRTLLKAMNPYHQATQSQSVVCDDTFNLMELCQMCCIQCLVSEDTVDREVSCWWRKTVGTFLLCQLVQHGC